jgi:hypothetical protein
MAAAVSTTVSGTSKGTRSAMSDDMEGVNVVVDLEEMEHRASGSARVLGVTAPLAGARATTSSSGPKAVRPTSLISCLDAFVITI